MRIRRRFALGRRDAEACVPPDPRTVVALHGVVQDPSAQGRLGAGRVVLDRARQQLVETGKALRPVDEVGDHLRLLAVDAGSDVDEDDRTHELGRDRGERDGGEPAERHADHPTRVRGQLTDGDGDVGRERLRCDLTAGRLVRAVGVTVPRQVDRDQGTVDRHRDRVPGVRVLRAAMEEHVLGFFGAPHQRAELATVTQLDEHAPDRRRTVVGKPELFRVLVEQTELVVLDTLHRTTLSSSRDAQHQRSASQPASLERAVRWSRCEHPSSTSCRRCRS